MNIKYKYAFLIKLILFLILSGILIGLALSQQMVQEPKSYWFHSRIGGNWLTVYRANAADDPTEWNPSYVSITSSYKPIVRKHGDKWEIEFVSEIAQELP